MHRNEMVHRNETVHQNEMVHQNGKLWQIWAGLAKYIKCSVFLHLNSVLDMQLQLYSLHHIGP